MLKNYIKVAWRNLKKQPFFTFLNVFGLAIGITGVLLISLYIYDELSYDSMFPDANRIYRVNADIKFGGERHNTAEVSAPMAEAILRDISQVEQVTRFRNWGSTLIREQGQTSNVKEELTTYADSTMFNMLGLKLLYGDTRTALTAPNTLVLSKTAAEKLFPVDQALGKTVILNDNETYTVTGVIDDLPKNSFLRERSLFLSMAGYQDSREKLWGNHNYYTLIRLIPGAKPEDIQATLQGMVGKYVIPYVQRYFPGMTEQQFIDSGNYLKFSTIALENIHLHSQREPEFSANGDIKNIYILAIIGIFLIVLASVNFMNLSTAQSLKRAKEVGIRKTLGSEKAGLIKQFLIESAMLTFGALILAILLSLAILPFFNDLAAKELYIPFSSPVFWGIIVAGTVLLGLLAGSYPAFFMSRFVPVKVLKGLSNTAGGSRIRNSLVILQFAVSIFLIIGTLVIFQQLQYIRGKDLGYDKSQVLVINETQSLGSKRQAFKREIMKLSQVEDATLSSFLPTPSSRSSSTFLRDENRDQDKAINMQYWDVDEDYLKTMDLKLVSGRNFDRLYGTDSTALILNEEAVKILGRTPENVLGMRLVNNFDVNHEILFTVIGVVKNFHYESLRNHIGALSMRLGGDPSAMAVKLTPGDVSATVASVRRIWGQLAPEQPFDYYFMDASFNRSYDAEQRLGTIFMTFTILSILIACLGLFGLSAYNAEKRIKEVGVRKVLGAGVGQVAYQLSVDFLKLVSIAIVIAIPLGWYLMDKWLEDFSYRIQIPWWIMALAAFLAIMISLITVSYQSIKAALANPVTILRSE